MCRRKRITRFTLITVARCLRGVRERKTRAELTHDSVVGDVGAETRDDEMKGGQRFSVKEMRLVQICWGLPLKFFLGVRCAPGVPAFKLPSPVPRGGGRTQMLGNVSDSLAAVFPHCARLAAAPHA